MKDIQRNCLTLLFGTILYILTLGFLRLRIKINPYFEVFHNFYAFIIFADMCTMAVIYREYYGRNIVSEITDSPTDWTYDDNTKKYVQSDLSEKQQFFKDKIDKLHNIDNTLEEANNIVETFKDKIDQIDDIQEELDELDSAIKYHPDSPLVKELAKNYKETATLHDNN